MRMQSKNWFKFIIGIVSSLLIRLIPFKPPNIEPILAIQMPFSKAYGAQVGFIFAFINMFLFDLITSKVGLWTIITATSYGLLGVWSAFYFKNRKNSAWNYFKFAFFGTIVFDAATGLSVGPLFFHQPFVEAFLGQIPFTAMHLVGNLSFALVLSPALFSFVIKNTKLETRNIISIFRNKNV